MRIIEPSIVVLAALFTSPAPAQASDPRVAKAIVVADSEHDPVRARSLFEQVSNDASATLAARTDARLWLGRLAERGGRADEARTFFEAAAKGQGPSVAEARRLLAEQDPQGDVNVQGRVHQLILQLRRGEIGSLDGLVWMGAAAVPLLTQNVDSEPIDLDFVTRSSKALMRIGGPEVVEWLAKCQRDYDIIKRRAVVRGINHATAATTATFGSDIRTQLFRFLDDGNPIVRREAFGACREFMEPLSIVGMMVDSDSEVRAAAWNYVSGAHFSRALSRIEPDAYIAVLSALERQLRNRPAAVPENAYLNAVDKMGSEVLTQTEPGRAVFLRGLSLPGVRRQYSAPNRMPDLRVNEQLDAVLAVAREIGPADGLSDSGDLTSRTSKPQFNLQMFLNHAVRFWDHEAIPTAIELMALRYSVDQQWLIERLDDDTWPLALARLDDLPLDSALNLLRNVRDDGVPAGCFPVLRKWIEGQLSGAELIDNDRTQNLISYVCFALGAIETEEAESWVEQFVRNQLWDLTAVRKTDWIGDGVLVPLVAGLVSTGDSKFRRKTMRRLVDYRNDKAMTLPYERNNLLSRLAQLADAQSVELFAKAYDLGLESRGRGNMRGWQWASPQWNKDTGYDDATAAKIVDSCLATGSQAAWDDWTRKRPSDLPLAHRRAVARNWKVAPAGYRVDVLERVYRMKGGKHDAGLGGSLLEMMTADDAELRQFAVRHITTFAGSGAEVVRALIDRLDDARSEVVVDSLTVLSRLGKAETVPAIRTALAHGHGDVRYAATEALIRLEPDRATDIALAAFDDTASIVRFLACEFAQKSLDKQFVPKLIEALRDQSLREKAKEALEAIRFYHDNLARWKRMLEDAGMTSESAAEALVEQARKSDSKKVRLAAIHSLGTLGVAETLPFLIQLMQDADTDIAAAAEAAIEKINSRQN